ncbi:MAG TPA: hypothetical protein VLH79_03100 [Chthonomonadales bacterium]|nr:hypothetical protein [Chthonomonadales bacterium]
MLGRVTGASLCAVGVVLAFSAFSGQRSKPSEPAARPKCPAGGNYYLKTKPDKEHSIPVKINGTTYYVCSHCRDMGCAKAVSKRKPASGSTAASACAGCPAKERSSCPASLAKQRPTKGAPDPATR